MKTYHIFDFELVFKKGKFKLYDKKSVIFSFLELFCIHCIYPWFLNCIKYVCILYSA